MCLKFEDKIKNIYFYEIKKDKYIKRDFLNFEPKIFQTKILLLKG